MAIKFIFSAVACNLGALILLVNKLILKIIWKRILSEHYGDSVVNRTL
jgi:hypothetical protein